MAINKSASKIGTIEFKTALYIGANSNAGYTIVWQSTNGGRAKRVTGKNITGLVKELATVLANNEGTWVGDVNAPALMSLMEMAL